MLICVVGMSFGGCLFVFSSFWFILVGMGLGWIDGMFILVHRSTKSTLGSYKTHKLKIIIPNFLMEGSSRGKEPAEATFPILYQSNLSPDLIEIGRISNKKRSWIKLRVNDE